MKEEKKFSFAINDIQLAEDESKPKSKFAKVILDFFASGDNAHEIYVDEDVLEKTAHTIYNVPIVWVYDKYFDDVGSHDAEEVPCGFVMDGQEIERVKLSDGRTMLRAIGYIWKKYSGKLMEILERDDGEKPVSVEMSVYEMGEDKERQKDTLLDYVYEAVTILGTGITPAIPSAGMSVVSFSKEKEEYIKDYLEFSNSRYGELDMLTPAKMKNSAKRGLEMAEETGGATAVSISMAKNIVKQDTLEPDKIRQIGRYFQRMESKGLSGVEDVGVGWELYGGDIGFSWSRKLLVEMKELDERIVAHFDESHIDDDKKEKMPLDEEMQGSSGKEEEKNMKKEEEEKENEDVLDEEVNMAEEKEKKEEEEEFEETPEEEEEEEEFEEAPEDEEEEEGFTLSSLRSQFSIVLEEFKYGEDDEAQYYVSSHDDTHVYAICNETGKYFRMPYTVSGMEVSVAFSEKEEVVFSPELVGVAEAKDSELAELREFKSNVEKQQFAIRVEEVISSISKTLSKEKVDEAREDALSFSLETFSEWANTWKAKAFEFSVKNPKTEDKDDGVVKIPFGEETKKPKIDSLWD